MRTIAVITGTRADYGLLKPVMQAISEHPDLQLKVVLTGMHLDPAFGNSGQLVYADGFPVFAEVAIETRGDNAAGMALSVGQAIQGMTPVLERMQPDVVVVLGDRTEILGAGIATAYLNIPLAHIHGGDKSRGGLDESARHCLSKLAHIHFPATAASAERIRKMGEEEERIFVTGAPCLDTILHQPLLERAELEKALGIPLASEYALLVQHAVSTEPELAVDQFEATVQALRALEVPTVIIYPNSDAGGRQLIQRIEVLEAEAQFAAFPSLPHATFLSLMAHCSFMLGNSSSGVIESSSFKVPVIDLGIRQEGRERAANVVSAPHDREAIKAAVELVRGSAFRENLQNVVNPYGMGDTGIQIAEILANFDLNRKLLQKQITY